MLWCKNVRYFYYYPGLLLTVFFKMKLDQFDLLTLSVSENSEWYVFILFVYILQFTIMIRPVFSVLYWAIALKTVNNLPENPETRTIKAIQICLTALKLTASPSTLLNNSWGRPGVTRSSHTPIESLGIQLIGSLPFIGR